MAFAVLALAVPAFAATFAVFLGAAFGAGVLDAFATFFAPRALVARLSLLLTLLLALLLDLLLALRGFDAPAADFRADLALFFAVFLPAFLAVLPAVFFVRVATTIPLWLECDCRGVKRKRTRHDVRKAAHPALRVVP